MADPPRWVDTITEALHPNATSREEIFNHSFSLEQLDVADHRMCELIGNHTLMCETSGGGVIFVDAQHYMYLDLLEPQKIIQSHGYKFVESLLGGEIIVFQKGNCFLLLHGHLAIAGDSREEISAVASQRRGTVASILKQVRRFATGEINSADEDFDDSAIHGTLVMEVNNRGLHGSHRFSAAMYRDSVTPSNFSALDSFGGGMTPEMEPCNSR